MFIPYRKMSASACVVAVCASLGFPAAAETSSLTVNGVYQESTNNQTRNGVNPTPGACNNAGKTCRIVFEKIPAGRQLTVTHVSCELNATAGEVSKLVLYPARPNGSYRPLYQWLSSSTRPSNTVGSHIVVNNAAYQLFDEKDIPLVGVETTENSAISGWCSITGKLTDIAP